MPLSRSATTAVVASLLLPAGLVPAAPAHAAVATCHGVRATITGFGVIRGTNGRDVIVGSGGNDTILGRGGNDLICAGVGADRLFGGAGNDRLYGETDDVHSADEDGIERVGDTLRGGPGNDRLDGGADPSPADIVIPDTYSWSDATHGVRIDLRAHTAQGQGSDRLAPGPVSVVGSPHADIIDGTDRSELIEAGAGPDIIRSRGGDDFIYPDLVPRSGRPSRAGDADQIWAGSGNDRVRSLRGHDRIVGGPGSELIEVGGGGNDVVLGGAGDDFIFAEITDTAGPQDFEGGPGVDSIGLDTARINPTGATSTGTWNMVTGAMTFTLTHKVSLKVGIHRGSLSTTGTSWTVTGSPGDDRLNVGRDSAGAHFSGLAGDDTFGGSDASDVFDGGPGADTTFGMGAGDDTCTSVESIFGADCEHINP